MTLLMLGDFLEKLTVKVSSIVHRMPAKYIVQDTWHSFLLREREKNTMGYFFSLSYSTFFMLFLFQCYQRSRSIIIGLRYQFFVFVMHSYFTA